ncbi:hypothetical protein DRO69_11925 [Candidatus Bathyarchaeota archaeon]|nr:MAG: hypothetical protein DRO69_11925 [Candidatus Bathyarchaeota archaeon]
MEIPFDFGLAVKILRFFLIINLAVLPLLLLLNLNLSFSYVLIILFEGFCSLILGGIQVFNSLFSTIEREDHRYIGHGFFRYQLKSTELTPSRKIRMRKRGITMMIMGLIFILSPILLIYLYTIIITHTI